ncbi:MAG: hypothetical protein QOJ44_1829, partial [Acidimicrobiaceae bacterium]|nr:hypothetical protein [Acidimicrobiaceae bacterium]
MKNTRESKELPLPLPHWIARTPRRWVRYVLRVSLALATAATALVTVAVTSGVSSAVTPTTWTNQSPATSPTARGGASMAYDPGT